MHGSVRFKIIFAVLGLLLIDRFLICKLNFEKITLSVDIIYFFYSPDILVLPHELLIELVILRNFILQQLY